MTPWYIWNNYDFFWTRPKRHKLIATSHVTVPPSTHCSSAATDQHTQTHDNQPHMTIVTCKVNLERSIDLTHVLQEHLFLTVS